MKRVIGKLFKDESGQGTTEYIIIVSLIAIALIATWVIFQEKIKEFIGHLGEDLGEADQGTGN
ncbi:MAG: hypothetical protein KGY61_07205 [Desulfobacterales bacterium]|nr:hypothetical protein [Desulfobacterales bacterium]